MSLDKNTDSNNEILLDDIVLVYYADGTELRGRVLHIAEDAIHPWIIRTAAGNLIYIYMTNGSIRYIRLFKRSWLLDYDERRTYGFTLYPRVIMTPFEERGDNADV